jgi:hypothetical protein
MSSFATKSFLVFSGGLLSSFVQPLGAVVRPLPPLPTFDDGVSNFFEASTSFSDIIASAADIFFDVGATFLVSNRHLGTLFNQQHGSEQTSEIEVTIFF